MASETWTWDPDDGANVLLNSGNNRVVYPVVGFGPPPSSPTIDPFPQRDGGILRRALYGPRQMQVTVDVYSAVSGSATYQALSLIHISEPTRPY